jgi:hypothetical protein
LESLEDRCLLSISAMANTIAPIEGAPFSGLIGTFTSTRSGARPSDFNVTISWGDAGAGSGTVTQEGNGTFDISANHTYAEAGHYNTSLIVSDAVALEGATASGNANVADAALNAQGINFGATEQQQFSGGVATFTDANPDSTTADFSATINWGDGVASPGTVSQPGGAGTTYLVSGTHTYPADGMFAVTVQIADVAGSTATANSTATVANSAVATIQATGASFNGMEAQAFNNVTVATFTDSLAGQTAADYTAQIDWRDGQTTAGAVTQKPDGSFTVTGSHTYAADGTVKPLVTIQDINHAQNNDSAVATATVTDAPLNGAAVAVNVAHGVVVTNQLVATFTDTAPAEPVPNYSASINWGDGTAASAGTITFANGTFSVSGTHTYATPGKYNLGVTINDQGGASVAVNPNAVIGSQNERFVAHAYLDLLGRPVDAGGLAYWSNRLDQGLNRGVFVLILEGTTEYRTKLVDTFYRAYLGRPGDQGGLSFFATFLGSGGTVEQVKAILLGSQEYLQNHPDFLGSLFQDVLGRPIEQTARDAFNRLMQQGASRTQVALIVVSSSEAEARVVQALYQTFVHRPADQAGLNFYVNALQHGARFEAVVADIVGSQEYYNQV